MLGAPLLADLARELHDAIDGGARQRWPALLARIDDAQAAIDRVLAEYLGRATSAPGACG
jgi:hypothetical protein